MIFFKKNFFTYRVKIHVLIFMCLLHDSSFFIYLFYSTLTNRASTRRTLCRITITRESSRTTNLLLVKVEGDYSDDLSTSTRSKGGSFCSPLPTTSTTSVEGLCITDLWLTPTPSPPFSLIVYLLFVYLIIVFFWIFRGFVRMKIVDGLP